MVLSPLPAGPPVSPPIYLPVIPFVPWETCNTPSLQTAITHKCVEESQDTLFLFICFIAYKIPANIFILDNAMMEEQSISLSFYY